MRVAYPSLSRAIETGPTARFVSDFRRLPKGNVQMVETQCPPGAVSYTCRPELTLTQTLKADKPGTIRGLSSTKRYIKGDFELAPAASAARWQSDGRAGFMNLAIPVDATTGLVPVPQSDFSKLHDATFRCPTLEVLLGQLWHSLGAPQMHSPLLSEGLYQAIVGQLINLSHSATKPTRTGALDQHILDQINELIAESSETKLGLKDFAALAGMSVPTFTRRFKATTGQSVHQYVMDQRITRARQMLLGGRESIATIAHRCGFSSQSHMTDVFRNRLGVAPGSYRRGAE